jgi:hypothetical protein
MQKKKKNGLSISVGVVAAGFFLAELQLKFRPAANYIWLYLFFGCMVLFSRL